VNAQTKLIQLHELIKKDVARLKLPADIDVSKIVSSLDLNDHPDKKLQQVWLAYGRNEADFFTIQITLMQKEVSIGLTSKPNTGKVDRENFQKQMHNEEYRKKFFTLLTGLGAGYWIEIVGDKKAVEVFQNEDALWEFTKADHWMHYTFSIGKNFSPGDAQISTDLIAPTIMKELEKLVLLYRHLSDTRGK